MTKFELVFSILGTAAALSWTYELGRARMKREILAHWAQFQCRECGAVPRATLVHVSGCASGWEPAKQFDVPGETL